MQTGRRLRGQPVLLPGPFFVTLGEALLFGSALFVLLDPPKATYGLVTPSRQEGSHAQGQGGPSSGRTDVAVCSASPILSAGRFSRLHHGNGPPEPRGKPWEPGATSPSA